MNKELWLIWKEPLTRRRYKIGSLSYKDNNYTFKYDNELEEVIKMGFDFFPGFDDLKQEYTCSKLFSNIATRLPNKGREDYLEILNAYNLDINSSDLDILTATRGRLFTDDFEFVEPFSKYKLEFDLAGTRYSNDIDSCKNLLSINDRLYFELEPLNLEDKNAIKVVFYKNQEKYMLGYVPRYYSKELSDLLKNNVKYSAMIKSINFNSSFYDEDITACVKLLISK